MVKCAFVITEAAASAVGEIPAVTCQTLTTKTTDPCGSCPAHCSSEVCLAPNHVLFRSYKAGAAAPPACQKTRGSIVDSVPDALGADWKCECGKTLSEHPAKSAAASSKEPPAVDPMRSLFTESHSAIDKLKDTVISLATAVAKSTGAQNDARSAGVIVAITRKDFGLPSAALFDAHPYNYTPARLKSLLRGLCGPSKAETEAQRRFDKAMRAKEKEKKDSTSVNAAELDSPESVVRMALEVGIPIDQGTLLGGLSGASTAIIALNTSDDPSKAPIVSIPAACLRHEEIGSLPAQAGVLPSLLVHLEKAGRDAWIVVFKRLDKEHANDAVQYIRFDEPKKKRHAIRWVQRAARIFLLGYRRWTRSRPYNWTPPSFVDVLSTQLLPITLLDRTTELELLPFFTHWGLLSILGQADRVELLGQSLRAMETWVESIFDAWQTTYVHSSHNRSEYTLYTSQITRATTTQDTTRKTGGPSGGRPTPLSRADGQPTGRADSTWSPTRVGNSPWDGSAGDGAFPGNQSSGSPTGSPLGGGRGRGGGGFGSPGRGSQNPSRPPPNIPPPPPGVFVEPDGSQKFNRCFYAGCTSSIPPTATLPTVRSVFCRIHKKEFLALPPQQQENVRIGLLRGGVVMNPLA